MTRAVAAALAFVLALPARGTIVAGREVPPAIEVAGARLLLNGAGIRTRLFFKVYVGALYLSARSSDAAAIVAADEPKAVRVFFLRNVSRDQLRKAYHLGIERNSPGPRIPELEAELDRLSELLPLEIKAGTELSVIYVPGEGTTLTTSDGTRGTVAGKEFADAMFRTWLGDHVADEDLRDAMLGR